jgi:SAM-dependent methyltransferase
MPNRAKAAVKRLVTDEVSGQTREAEARLAQLVKDVETRQSQLETALQLDLGFLPLPPKHLQVRIGGVYVNFISHGHTLCEQIDRHLSAAVGRGLASFQSVLDFGCGCGRVTRPVRRLVGRGPHLHGLDIDPEAIAWARANYAAVADFRVGPTMPPTPYADGTFDLVYGISVFTHLPEDMQFAWLDELKRVTRPGGVLLLTTHGEVFLTRRPEWASDPAAVRRGFVYRAGGDTPGLPGFYQDTYHSHEYIRREWGRRFEVVRITTTGLDEWQDVVVLRRG